MNYPRKTGFGFVVYAERMIMVEDLINGVNPDGSDNPNMWPEDGDLFDDLPPLSPPELGGSYEDDELFNDLPPLSPPEPDGGGRSADGGSDDLEAEPEDASAESAQESNLARLKELLQKLKDKKAEVPPALAQKISKATEDLKGKVGSAVGVSGVESIVSDQDETEVRGLLSRPDLESAKKKANASLDKFIKWAKKKSDEIKARTTNDSLPILTPPSEDTSTTELNDSDTDRELSNETKKLIGEKAKELVDKMKGSVPWQTMVLATPSIVKGVITSVAKSQAKEVVGAALTSAAVSTTLEVGSNVAPIASAFVAAAVDFYRLGKGGSAKFYENAATHTSAAFRSENSERTGSESEAEYKKNKKEGRLRVPSKFLRRVAVAMNALRNSATQVGMGVTRDRSRVSKVMDAIEQAGGRFSSSSEDVQFKLKEAIREKDLTLEDIISLGKRLGRLRTMGFYGKIDVYGAEGAKGIRIRGKDWLDNSVNPEHTPEKMKLLHEALNAVVHDEGFWRSLMQGQYSDVKVNSARIVSELQTDWDKEYTDLKRKRKDLAGKSLALLGTAVGTFMMAKAAGSLATLLADKIDDIDIDALSAKVSSAIEQVDLDELVNSVVQTTKSGTEAIGNLARLASDEAKEQASYIAMAGSAKMQEARETLAQLNLSQTAKAGTEVIGNLARLARNEVKEAWESRPPFGRVRPVPRVVPDSLPGEMLSVEDIDATAPDAPELTATPIPVDPSATPESVDTTVAISPMGTPEPTGTPDIFARPEATPIPVPASEPLPSATDQPVLTRPTMTPESAATPPIMATPRPPVATTEPTYSMPIRPTVPAISEPTIPIEPEVATTTIPEVPDEVSQIEQPEVSNTPVQPSTVKPETVNNPITTPRPQEPLEAFNRPPVVPEPKIDIENLPGIENLAPNDRVPYNAIYQTIGQWVSPERHQGATNVATKFYLLLNKNLQVGIVTPDSGFALWNGIDLPDSLPNGAVAYFPTTEQLKNLTENVDAMLNLSPAQVQALTGEQKALYDVVRALNSGVNTEQVLQQIAQDEELRAQVLSLAREG